MLNKSFIDWLLKNPVKAVFLAFVLCLSIVIWMRRPIPFEAGMWKQADVSIELGVRYQMANNLIVKIEQMNNPTFEELRNLLGPSDKCYGNHEPKFLVYRLGSNNRLPLALETCHFHISFDENQQLRDVGIYTDSP